MVRCTVPLFLTPGWELGEGVAADPAALRALGDDLRSRCDQAAAVVSALRALGWSCRVGRNELVAEKACGRAAAMRDFLHADLDPVALTLEPVARQVEHGR
jgi:hypothetical protein